jgi:hypothetical protein
MLSQAQSDAEFLIAQLGTVQRKISRKIAFIVAGPAADRAFEQPIPNTIFRQTTDLANPAQQGGDVGGIPKPAGQGRGNRLLKRFHEVKIT